METFERRRTEKYLAVRRGDSCRQPEVRDLAATGCTPSGAWSGQLRGRPFCDYSEHKLHDEACAEAIRETVNRGSAGVGDTNMDLSVRCNASRKPRRRSCRGGRMGESTTRPRERAHLQRMATAVKVTFRLRRQHVAVRKHDRAASRALEPPELHWDEADGRRSGCAICCKL